MNNLIALGRDTFEFAGVDVVDKRGRLIKTGRGSLSRTDRTAAGAGAGALAGAGAAVGGSALIAKRRRAEKDRIKKGLSPGPGIPKRKIGRKPRQASSVGRAPAKPRLRQPPTANTIARAQMRRKYGKNWFQPGGSKRKLLGYGALAGAALGGTAGYYARKKKGDS